jgi:Fic family protein
MIGALKIINEINRSNEIDENNLLALHKIISEDLVSENLQGKFRSRKYLGHTIPEEILAAIVETFDWFNSLDAKETHPILLAGIIYGRLISIWPFENFNFTVAIFVSKIAQKIGGYNFKGFVCVEDFLHKSINSHQKSLDSIKSEDYTEFLEFFTQAMASEVANAKEKIMLLARDTKVAKASGTLDLSPRQSRVVEYLQDYGTLQNKDFKKLFDGVSEDSVLRDLKALLQKGIVVKKGSTKSSRYELR